ncbi:NAD-dependent epimerase [Kordiimonas sediminis]|uniref:NAD-dependent epimerase n=1 Tax=Kordiimonas sediminis TaxID=1735581 RepID=A0A919ASV9_9PROT|nr:NAD-dependent epimerase/dehydratase family protein [Kordiimonas sediminis]GHF23588.1 NAD-dependent epimerase [Kordiimonas sediminis]
MTVLVTGAAGFIGSYVAQSLCRRGNTVIGIDNLNDYYDPILKKARLSQLQPLSGFNFHHVDFADKDALFEVAAKHKITQIVHLGAQAGVRYSIDNPDAYVASNLVGHVNILELARHTDSLDHLVYASSSSVYGGNSKLPFSEQDTVNNPVSLYAATKRADELLSQSYAHLYGLPQTGLRFFTVYGPWGRPDMAYFLFTKAILEDNPITIFNNGDMGRDFTYIDDVVTGLLSVLDTPPETNAEAPPHRLYNIGNNRPERLMTMIEILEELLGKKAIKQFKPMQAGDVKETFADITALQRDFGFSPSTPLTTGLQHFTEWYRSYYS